jgi:hypothetical protein
MSNADKYRAHACHCVIKAEQAHLIEDKLFWLCMAQTWLGMIRRLSGARTSQVPSESQH